MKIGRNEIVLFILGCFAFWGWLTSGGGAILFMSGFAFGACLIMGMADSVIEDALRILNKLRDDISNTHLGR